MRTALFLTTLLATLTASADPAAPPAPAPTATARPATLAAPARPTPAAAPAGGPTAAPVTLSLNAAVERALQVDPQVLSAVVNLRRSELALHRAKLDRFSLKVDASLSEGWQAINFLSTVKGTSVFPSEFSQDVTGHASIGASAQFPIYAGNRVSATISKNRHLREAAAATEKATARSVALDVLRAYWAVRRVELQTAVSADALGRYEEAVTVVGARVRAGLAPPVDVNRIETRRQREKARLAGLEGTAREGLAQLAVALGYGGHPLTLTEPAAVPPPPTAGSAAVDDLLRAAREGRADLVSARRQTAAAEDQIKVARSGYYPQLTAVGSLQYGNGSGTYGYTACQFLNNCTANPFTNLSGTLFLGANLTINLFDTWNTKTQVQDAEYEVARLKQEERRLGRVIEADVRTAHARLERLYATREALVKTRDLAKDTLGIVKSRYQNGEALILDYLDAQFDLLNAEIDLADSAAAIAIAWGELWAATGRLPGVR
jgi:outer membrane protein TolC